MSTRSEALPAQPAQAAKRHDIQGLRALAVLLVIADHAFGQPVGGFIGVDVFFVLSGFLMTSVLYREFERTGRIRFLAFYRRRIRRLIPAAATTIAVTVGAAFLLFASGRFQATLWDALSALGFVSNWRYAALATDYFQQNAVASPLQHFWSLSVEEQYYLVWPLGLLCLCVLAYSTTLRRPIVAVLVGAFTLGMFALSLTLTASDPAAAYFITPARVWELSLGGVVALCMPAFDRLGPALRPYLMAAGVAGIGVAAVITPSTTGFPAPWAALAVVSTALVLAFPWHPARFGQLNPLTNRVVGYIGDLSYSLYLWHFPAIVLVAEAFRGLPMAETAVPAAVAVVVAFGLAALSFRFVEEPVRRSRWLEPGRTLTPASAARRKAMTVGALAVTCCATVVIALTLNRVGPAPAHAEAPAAGAATATAKPGTETEAAPGTATAGPQAAASDGAAGDLTRALTEALAASSWPQLTTDPGDPQPAELDPRVDRCSSFKYAEADCVWGDPSAPKTAVLVGDSIAAAYLPGLIQVFGSGDWKLRSAAMYACPFVDLRIGPSAKKIPACTDRKQLEVDLVKSTAPDLVIVANTYWRDLDQDTGRKATLSAWKDGLDRQLTQIDGSYRSIVALPGPPYEKSVDKCYSPRTSPVACVTNVQKSDYAASMAMLTELMNARQGTVLDNVGWFCVDGRCPPFAGSTLVKADLVHPSTWFALDLVPVMREAFAPLMAG